MFVSHQREYVGKCYDDVRSAGFVVDSHSNYRSITNSTMLPTLKQGVIAGVF